MSSSTEYEGGDHGEWDGLYRSQMDSMAKDIARLTRERDEAIKRAEKAEWERGVHCDDAASLLACCHKREDEIARLTAVPGMIEQSCPHCGVGVESDEDGCCMTCGAALCGVWLTEAFARLTRERDEAKAQSDIHANHCRALLEMQHIVERERDEAMEKLHAPVLVSSNGEAGDHNEDCGCCGEPIGLSGPHEWRTCAEQLSKSEADAVNRLVDMEMRAEAAEQKRDAINSSICDARDLAYRYAGIEGDHHKQWVIDQMLRLLLGPDEYVKFVEEYGSDPGYDPWNEGIAP